MDSPNDSFKCATFDGYDQNKKTDSVRVPEGILNEKHEEEEQEEEEEEEEEEYRRKTRKRLLIIGVSGIILVLLIIGATIGVLIPMHAKNDSSSFSGGGDAIMKMCNSTLYQDSCYYSIYSLKLSSFPGGKSNSNDDSPMEIFMLSLQVAVNELVRVKSSMSKRAVSFLKNDNSVITRNALDNCVYLIQDAIDHVNMSMLQLDTNTIDPFSANLVSDIRTWLSTAITDQQTCLDGLMEFEDGYISPSLQEEVHRSMKNSTIFTSNSLAIISNIFAIIKGFRIPVDRKLLQEKEGHPKLRPNLTVAKDGSGDYRSINEAVNVVPKGSLERFFIYVKEGEYEENVFVSSEYWNVVIYGDGMNKTIVSARLNFADGVATFNTGTFIVEGRGFIAQDIGFRNTAGPEKLQAVALRSSSDRSIFHRCLFDGFQDTLYAHTNRQFYSNCLVLGTIDFIFGNAAAVFENCSIQPRQPAPGQYNTITAQSKSDPNENTGFAIHQCRISPFGNLTARTFLGRPWNNYSTTIFMETDMDRIIDREGWIAWEPGVEAPDTIFYAEYNNSGPGSSLDRRVKWSGYHRNVTEEEAGKFSVENFIQGDKWIPLGTLEYDSHI